MTDTQPETQADVFVKGRGQRTALLLLTAAAELEQPKQVVRAQLGGYRVPADVAERYEKLDADLAKDEAKNARSSKKTAEPSVASADTPPDSQDPNETPPETQAKAPRKTAARKTAAKKTTAKKTAAKSTTASAKE